MSTKSSVQRIEASYKTLFSEPPTITQGGQTFSPVLANRTRTGVALPNWWQLIADGKNATTAFTGTIQEITAHEAGYCAALYVLPNPTTGVPRLCEQKFDGVENIVQFVSASGVSVTTAESLALQNLYRRVKAANQQWSAPTFLGEILEVKRMLKNPALALRKGLGDYLATLGKRKRGIRQTPKGRKTLRRISAETWLEYSFGWVPLLSDIGAAAETLARFETESDSNRRRVVSSYGQDSRLNSDQLFDSVTSGLARLRYFRRIVQTSQVDVFYRVGLNYKFDAPYGSSRRLAELSGFKITEFVPTAWELLPWSFVVDYFSNVGDIIGAAFMDTSSVAWICKSTVTKGLWSSDTRLQRIPNPGTGHLGYREGRTSHGNWKSVNKSVTRASVSGLSLPKLEFRLPGGSIKWINLAALATGVRKLTPYG